MKKSLRFWIVPLFLLAGLAMGACSGDFPLDINSEEGIKQIFSDLDVDDIEFTGAVQDISLETWTVSDLAVGVTPETDIDDEIATGDVVKVKAVVFKDGSLLAVEIESDSDKDDDLDLDKFELAGIVKDITQSSWVVSDLMIGISEETEIGDDISIGDTVEVEGLIAEGGTLLAIEIELDEKEVEEKSDVTEVDDLEDDDIEFTGLVQAIAGDAWVIGSKTVFITPESEIDDDITIGDVVEVEAQINEDGSLTALEIELENDDLEDNDLDSDLDDADDDDSSEADYLDDDNDSDEDDVDNDNDNDDADDDDSSEADCLDDDNDSDEDDVDDDNDDDNDDD